MKSKLACQINSRIARRTAFLARCRTSKHVHGVILILEEKNNGSSWMESVVANSCRTVDRDAARGARQRKKRQSNYRRGGSAQPGFDGRQDAQAGDLSHHSGRFKSDADSRRQSRRRGAGAVEGRNQQTEI